MVDQMYIDNARNYLHNFHLYQDVIPSIPGVCLALGVNRKQLDEMGKASNDMQLIIDLINLRQEHLLINMGVAGKASATITKLLLAQHGYAEKTQQDITSSDESLTATVDVTKLSIDSLKDIIRAGTEQN